MILLFDRDHVPLHVILENSVGNISVVPVNRFCR